MTTELYDCIICGGPAPDYAPKFCCSGYKCGCEGQPEEPPLCSEMCADAAYDYIGLPFNERRIRAGIFKYKPRPVTSC